METDEKESDEKESDEDILILARQRFADAEEHDSDNRDLAAEDLRFSEGDQWPQAIKDERDRQKRPCLVINNVPVYIRQIVNDIRQIRPAIKVRAVDSAADPETAEILNGMIRAIEADSTAESAYDWGAEYAVRSGVGYWRIDTEYEHPQTFDQVIKVKRVRNVFSVYLDPAAEEQDGSDAQWGFITTKIRKEEFERKYPDAKGEWDAGEGKDDTHWFTDTHVRVSEYWAVSEEPFTLSLLIDQETGQQVLTDLEGQEVPPGLEMVAERESSRRKVIQRLITGNEILETTDWLGDYIPIVRCMGREINIEGETKLKGAVRDLMDAQRQYNYFRSASTERAALYSKAPWVGPTGSFKNPKWKSANSKNYAFLEYDVVEGAPPPHRDPPPDISPGFSQEVMIAREELKSVSGIHDAGIGARSNEVSGVAIHERRGESDVSNFDFVDNVARAQTYTGKILVDLIPKIYTGPRVIKILQPDGSEEQVKINEEYIDPATQKTKNYQLNAGRYDVTVDVGPSYATKREEAATSMLDFLQKAPQAAPLIGDLVAKNMDWPDSDEIAKRLKLTLPPEILADENPQFKAAMQQKDQQIAQLSQQMQMLMTEAQKMSIELQNKNTDAQVKQGDLLRKVKKDMMDHIEGMTDLELQAGRDLNDAGAAYTKAMSQQHPVRGY